MASEIFANMLKKAELAGAHATANSKANKWFRDMARKVSKSQTDNIMRESTGKFRTAIVPGSMYCFYYDPKHKDTLPYYDMWPIIFPIVMKNDRFLGINFHYLQPTLRAKVLDALYQYTNNKKMDETTRMKLQMDVLKAASKYSLIKPTLHWYLKSHVRSKFVKIEPNEWEFALYLPMDRFVKATRTTVWKESRIKAGLK